MRLSLFARQRESVRRIHRRTWMESQVEGEFDYLDLVRRLPRMVKDGIEPANNALAALTDETLIRRSRALPFDYLTAIEATNDADLPGKGAVLDALNDAVEKSLVNMPLFEGRTLVALDGSGSMHGQPLRLGALFTAAMVKTNGADVILFSDRAQYMQTDRRRSTLALARWLEIQAPRGGTNFSVVFQTADMAYDRILIVSDRQMWLGPAAPRMALRSYKMSYRADPKLYVFNLRASGALQSPEPGIYCLAGVSGTMDTLKWLDSNKAPLPREIEAIEV